MKEKLKGFYLLVSSLFIAVLHLPLVFAKPISANRLIPLPAASPASPPADSLQHTSTFKSVYDSLHLELSGLSRQAFEYAQKGWEKLLSQGRIINESIVAIVDFSQPSSHRRFYVLDMKNYKVLFNTLVAHGRNSGKEWASSFSNQPSSYKSSPGFFITGETYNGSNGYSLRLQGIERGINDKAQKRAIVMHGADYVDESYIEAQGYIGRSQGCPAVPATEAYPIINTIKEGTCLFVYTPDKRYTSRSALLKR
ncbi:MAG TPA: murein L,D-transpeptidase catalytic domain family protein [Chitinophagaceae bacterium]